MDKLFGIRLKAGEHESWLHNINQDWKTGLFFGIKGCVVYPTKEAAQVDFDRLKAESDKEIQKRSDREAERRYTNKMPDWMDSISVEELEPCSWEAYFFVETSSPAGKHLTNDYERGLFVDARCHAEALTMAEALPRDSRFNRVLVECKNSEPAIPIA
jgi:hypothetical protein